MNRVMNTLSPISVGDKVSSWIQLVNNIVSTIRLAVAPTVKDDGKLEGGNDGYMSKEDKKIIDDLPLTYMPIRGKLPGDATWYNVTEIDTSNALRMTVESNNVLVYNNDEDFNFEITSASKTEYATKYVCLNVGEKDYTCRITYNNQTEDFLVSAENKLPLVLKIIFVGGVVLISDEGFRLPEFKTINDESIIGTGNFELLREEDLKTINGESLVGNGDIKMLVNSDFKTINGESIIGGGDITTLQPEDFKTINEESLVGIGDIKMLVEEDFKTINDESLVGDGNIITLQSTDFKTINGEGLIGEGNFTLLVGDELKTINGESIIGIGDIVTLKASDFKTINGESIIGTGNIVIEGGSSDPLDKSRLGVARLGELVLGAKTV